MRQRMRIVSVCAAVLMAGVPATGEARGQAAPPSGETLLDNHVKAAGGRAAFDKLNTRTAKARIEVAAAGISMTVSSWAARPNKVRIVIESDVVGRVERGFDGTVGWELATTSGPRLFDGAQLDDLVRDSLFEGVAAWRDWVEKAETQGTAEVDGKPAWKVLVTPKRGSPVTYYFDQASSLAVKLEMTIRSPMGDVPTVNYVSDYRSVNGVRVAHRLRQVVGGQELVTTFESFRHNAEIPAGTFDLPKEIQALLGKK
jgi:hypothetical protein